MYDTVIQTTLDIYNAKSSLKQIKYNVQDILSFIKTINENNSMVMFHPDNNPPTLHAIRLKYNHLKYQRTQIYGNLMYKNNPEFQASNYKDFLNLLASQGK